MPRHTQLAFFLLLAATLHGCSVLPEPPPRPSNVPPDAIRLGGSKASWWVKCVHQAGANRCSVFNGGGAVLEDNSVYRPYDGGPAVEAPDLRIVPQRSMIQRLYLLNGRILLLDRVFDSHKAAIDLQRGVKR